MKKFISLLLVFVMLFGTVSCTSGKSNNEATVPSGVTTPEATAPEITTPEVTTPEITTPEITTAEKTEAPAENTVFDFVKNYKNLDGTYFSFAIEHPVHGILNSTTTWCDGTDSSIKNSAYGNSLVGYHTVYNKIYSVDVSLAGDKIVWYTGSSMLSNVICFTAPADGFYSYDFITYSLWGCSHSSSLYMVKVNGKIHNGNSISYPKGTLSPDTHTNFVGTAYLEAGEMIWFMYDPEMNMANDNSVISKLQVTYIGQQNQE